jgi:hypothetical protein
MTNIIFKKTRPWNHRHTLQISKPTSKRDSPCKTCKNRLKMESRTFCRRGRPTYHRDRPPSPTCRLVGLWVPHVIPSFVCRFSTASNVQFPPLLKVGSIRESRFDVAMDSWAHRTPGAPVKGPPYLLQKGTLHTRASYFHTLCSSVPLDDSHLVVI